MKVEKYLNLKEFVKKTVSEVLNEQFETSMIKAPSTIVQSDLLVEMSRINKNEQGNSIFPYNSFEVQVWSNDNNPPHFHVLSNGCNVSFQIENGKILNVESEGDNKTFNYIRKNVSKWLSSRNSVQPKLTNQEVALMQWQYLHND